MELSTEAKCNLQNHEFPFSFTLEKRIAVAEPAFFFIEGFYLKSFQVQCFAGLKIVFNLHAISSDVLDRAGAHIARDER